MLIMNVKSSMVIVVVLKIGVFYGNGLGMLSIGRFLMRLKLVSLSGMLIKYFIVVFMIIGMVFRFFFVLSVMKMVVRNVIVVMSIVF